MMLKITIYYTENDMTNVVDINKTHKLMSPTEPITNESLMD